jgi:hypothetical protein
MPSSSALAQKTLNKYASIAPAASEVGMSGGQNNKHNMSCSIIFHEFSKNEMLIAIHLE